MKLKQYVWLLLFPFAVFAQEQEDGLEEVVVVGTRASLQSAIERKEDANNIVGIIDADAFGDFPDTTAAEAIRRLSGVSVENDQGEGRYITLRGISSDLNSVAINGASIVAPENGRSVLLDGLPTELLDSIEVSMSLTSNQDLDSIGGRVDFRTKNPSDLDDDGLFNFKAESLYNTQTENANNPKLALTVGNHITDNLAHIFGMTYSSKQIVTYNNETGYGWEDGFMNDDYEMRYYDLTRERYGFTYDIDLLTGDTRWYANAFYNQYDDSELRWKDEYGKLDFVSALDNGMITSRIRHDAETRFRNETRRIAAANIGFDSIIADTFFVNSQLSYSTAEEDDTDNADITFRNYDKDLGGEIDWSDPQRPIVTAYDNTLRDPAYLEFDELELEDSISSDEEFAWTFDVNAMVADWIELDTGLKFRSRTKDRDNNLTFWSNGDATMADYNPVDLVWPWEGQTWSVHADPEVIFALQNQTDSLESEGDETFIEDFTTQEDISALYLMNTFHIGMDNLIIAGVRVENTVWESQAYNQDGEIVTANGEYTTVAPSITGKFYVTDNVVFRAAYWKSLSRPGFTQFAPITNVEIDGDEVSGSVGNPDLEPYLADNFDVAFEWYGDGIDFASIGLFHKSIDNAIYPTFQNVGTFNGIDFNNGVETYINADTSTINGVELNVQKEWDNGLFFAGNFTINDGESSFAFDGENVFTTPFRKLAKQAANLSLGYDKGPWDIRLAGNYRDSYLDYLADEEGDITSVSLNNSRFTDAHMQVDLTVKYDVNDALEVKFQGVNLNDRPEFYYWGNDNQLSQYDVYGSSYSLGFSYRL